MPRLIQGAVIVDGREYYEGGFVLHRLNQVVKIEREYSPYRRSVFKH